MSAWLETHVEPWALAGARRRLRGSLAPAATRRLETMGRLLERPRGELGFDLAPEGGRVRVGFALAARIERTCQRCLAPVEETVEAAGTWMVSPAGEPRQGRDGRHHRDADPDDGLEADDPDEFACAPGARVELRDALEEELMLALPMVPTHPRGACGGETESVGEAMDETTGQTASGTAGGIPATPARADESPPLAPGRRRPFAGLAALLQGSADTVAGGEQPAGEDTGDNDGHR